MLDLCGKGLSVRMYGDFAVDAITSAFVEPSLLYSALLDSDIVDCTVLAN